MLYNGTVVRGTKISLNSTANSSTAAYSRFWSIVIPIIIIVHTGYFWSWTAQMLFDGTFFVKLRRYQYLLYFLLYYRVLETETVPSDVIVWLGGFSIIYFNLFCQFCFWNESNGQKTPAPFRVLLFLPKSRLECKR